MKTLLSAISIIYSILVLLYYLTMFDYQHREFKWYDSIICIFGIGVLIVATNRKAEDKKGD